MPKKSNIINVKTDAEKYDKKTQREHILLRPDTYIGDIESTTETMYVYNEELNKIIKEKITYTPGFIKIFDEALINARDASVNDPSCDTIKIEYNMEEGYISIFNNGDLGIPIEEHPIHKQLVPSMIFGELLTSSNYDDTQERTTGGRNGIGSKAINIFSTNFIVEICDAKRGKHFIQEWTNNMLDCSEAIVSKLSPKTKSSVKIIFYPDFKRFGITDLKNDHLKLFHKRTIDIAGVSQNKLKVYFNDNKINITNFKSYIELYNDSTLYYDEIDRWNIGIIYNNEGNSDIISFVNGINTYRGGTHCSHVIDNITKTLINDYIKKKDKDLKITSAVLKDNLIFFINSIIVNPAFSSQTKDTLTTKNDKFGSKYEPTPTFLKKLSKCGIIEHAIELAKLKESSSLKKTDGKKQIKISGIPKLEDANKAGSKESNKCTLILTEGDSAKATAMAGLSVIGRDYFGIFPLKGKMLNVREATNAQLLNNEEIKCLKTIIGLKQGEDYSLDEKFNTLRYGHILMLTDSDVDGSHIKGLFMNMVHSLWPSLIKRTDFIQSLYTPIVKAIKGKETISFYNLVEYDNWIQNTNDSKNYKIKYYKGLGTSTSIEAKEYFTDINTKLITYLWENQNKEIIQDDDNEEEVFKEKPIVLSLDDEENNEDNEENEDTSNDNESYMPIHDDDDALRLAFDKKRANDRKKWLKNYDKNNILKYEQKQIPYFDFIHYDLIHFSNEDIIRSIPSVVDGLKPSHRKILYGSILRGLDKDEIKVSQLAGFVSDKAAYHHGEMSLNGAIIGMAQDYVGSNNINILKPNGQFGTRLKAGKDYASSRYIWTMLETLTPLIFNFQDTPVLNHLNDDGMPIEPEYYVPIIPMVLVNGTEGIGTGFSTKIPPFNPLEIINNLINMINNKPLEEMHPWWQGYKGTITKINETSFESKGVWEIKDNKLIITELPIGEATSNYKEFLEKMLIGVPVRNTGKNPDKKPKTTKTNAFQNYIDNNTDTQVYFELIFDDGYLSKNIDIEKIYKLSKKISLNNMHLYSPLGKIKKYHNIDEIMKDYYDIRIKLYEDRKQHQLNILKYQLTIISYKVKFILMVVSDELIVNKKKKSALELELESHTFPRMGKTINDNNISYDYLLSMPIYNLTHEKIEELKNQEDKKTAEYKTLENLTSDNIWLNELNELKDKYNEWVANKIVNSIPLTKPTKPTKKRK